MNPLLTGAMPGTMSGLRIIENSVLVDRVLHSRSPARAARRARRGHPQHYRTVPSRSVHKIGEVLVMHPATAKMLRDYLAGTLDKDAAKPHPRPNSPYHTF